MCKEYILIMPSEQFRNVKDMTSSQLYDIFKNFVPEEIVKLLVVIQKRKSNAELLIKRFSDINYDFYKNKKYMFVYF